MQKAEQGSDKQEVEQGSDKQEAEQCSDKLDAYVDIESENPFKTEQHCSGILVEDILEKNPYVGALQQMDEFVVWYPWRVYNTNPCLEQGELENPFEYYALEYWNSIETVRIEPGWQAGGHCGDCIKVPCTCYRCMLEGWYIEGLLILDDWNEFVVSSDLTFETKDDSVTYCIALTLCTLQECMENAKLRRDYCEEKKKNPDTYLKCPDFPSRGIQQRFDRFMNFSKAKQKEFLGDATRWLQYFSNKNLLI